MNYKIIGNWKMNKTMKETEEFTNKLLSLVQDSTNEVVLCVPFTDVRLMSELVRGTKVQVGAQNVHFEESGAYTGEVSAEMLIEAGATYVIIGHSERRQYFGETNLTVSKRTKTAIKHNLTPIVCIGENLTEREAGNTKRVLRNQIIESFKSITREEFSKVIVAYEPIWAIGTGKTATSDDANNTIAYVRSVLEEIFGDAKDVAILYGGSMNDKNAEELLNMPHINGGLIGGASLVAEKFAQIANIK